ncbi:MAG TPA: alpha/beta fold hydrolase [Negativicutes bacterium]
MKEHVWVASRSKRLSVMIHIPNTFTEGTPLIISCHGFTGDKIGANQLTLNLAKAMEQSGFAVIRFDYLGSGDSDGDFAADTLVTGWQQDLSSIFTWVKSQQRFSTSPIILYGHSLGGLVTLTHKEFSKDIAARIVFAPVVNAIADFRDTILGPELWQKSLHGEPIENFYGKGFKLNSQLVQDLVNNNYDPVGDMTQLTTPLLIVHGTADMVIPIQGSQELYKRYRGLKNFESLDVDHVATGAHQALQEVIVGWLKALFPRLETH